MEAAHLRKSLRGIMSYGDYEDLVEYREHEGWTVMPWIRGEEDFSQAQDRYRERMWNRTREAVQS